MAVVIENYTTLGVIKRHTGGDDEEDGDDCGFSRNVRVRAISSRGWSSWKQSKARASQSFWKEPKARAGRSAPLPAAEEGVHVLLPWWVSSSVLPLPVGEQVHFIGAARQSAGPPSYFLFPRSLKSPQRVNGGPRMYLIDRTALACLGEIRALDDESGSGGSAVQICST